jgi:hypothetical protein
MQTPGILKESVRALCAEHPLGREIENFSSLFSPRSAFAFLVGRVERERVQPELMRRCSIGR